MKLICRSKSPLMLLRLYCIVIISAFLSINIRADITIQAPIDIGHAPKGSNIWQAFTLCTDNRLDQTLVFDTSDSGLELYYDNGKKVIDNQLELPGQLNHHVPECTAYYILAKTQYMNAGKSPWHLEIKQPSDSDFTLSIPIHGQILSKEEWLETYPLQKTTFIYTGSLTFNGAAVASKQGFNNEQSVTTNMAFDGAGDLALIFDQNYQGKMHCIHKKPIHGNDTSSWTTLAEHRIPEGACGLAISNDDQIALTSDLTNELVIYDNCRSATPVASTAPGARYLKHACNVAFVHPKSNDLRHLVTLGQDSHYSPSTGNLVWLTLWNADLRSGNISYHEHNVQQVSHDATYAFIKTNGAIATHINNEQTQLAVTNLKSNQYFVSHYEVDPEHHLLRSAESESAHNDRFAVKQLTHHNLYPYRASVSELGNSVTIEHCDQDNNCNHHQTITAGALFGDNLTAFEPSHASFANTTKNLVITDKHKGALLFRQNSENFWEFHQILTPPLDRENPKRYNKALFSPTDLNLAVLSANSGSVHFFEWASCQTLKTRFLWSEIDVPRWWQQFVSSKCPKPAI